MPSTQESRIDGISTSTAIKPPCVTCSTANLTLSGEQTVNSLALITGDRVLVKNQTAGAENGIYVVNSSLWRRAEDWDGNRDVREGTLVIVNDDGGLYKFYRVTTADPITIGITVVVFADYTGAVDSDAIHDNVANEIASVANKVTPVAGDYILIEDSAAGNVKKHILVSSISGAAEVNDLTASVTWANIPDANVPASAVTQHVALINHDLLLNFTQTEHFTEASIDHTAIANIGTNSHAAIDTHIADGTLHFLEGAIDHTAILNIGTNSHAQIDTHIALVNQHIDWTAGAAGTIHTDNYIEGGAGTDTTAVHDNVAAEISVVTLKGSPVAGDFLLIEDSAAANVKKRVTVGSLPAGSEVNDLTASVTWANVPDANITQSSVTQHVAAINHDLLLNFTQTEHFTEASIDHTAIANIGTNSHAQIDTHIALVNQHIDWSAGAAGTIHTDNYIEGGAGTDTDAIHDNIAGEIFAVTLKGTLVAADIFLIEDSAAANVKKRTTMGDIDHDLLFNFSATEHFTEASIDHTAIANIGTNTHAQIDTHVALVNEHIDWSAGAAGTIHTDNYIEGGPGTDTDAIHDNVSAEISAITEKVSPVSADKILIEDSATGHSKKYIQITNLPAGAEINDLAGDGITGIADDQIAVGSGAGTAAYKTLLTGAVAYTASTNTLSQAALPDLSDVTAKTGTGTVVVMDTSPTIVTPTIASFANSAHDHEDAAGGATLASAATPTAIHDDVSGEFATEKVSPVSADRILIEDSATSFSKKYIQITNLPAGSEINDLAGDGISGIIDDQIAVGSGAGTAAYGTLPDGAVAYTTSTNTLSQAALADLSDGGDALTEIVQDLSPQLGAQLDVNTFGLGDGTLELLTFVETGSAINHIQITNAAIGTNPVIDAVGDDTDVDLGLRSKGTGIIRVYDDIVPNTDNNIDLGDVTNGFEKLFFGGGAVGTARDDFGGIHIYKAADIFVGDDNVFPGFYAQRSVLSNSSATDNTEDWTNLYQGDSTFPQVLLNYTIGDGAISKTQPYKGAGLMNSGVSIGEYSTTTELGGGGLFIHGRGAGTGTILQAENQIEETGTTTSAGTESILNDTGGGWSTDEHVGKMIRNINHDEVMICTSNTAIAIIGGELTGGQVWDNGDAYSILSATELQFSLRSGGWGMPTNNLTRWRIGGEVTLVEPGDSIGAPNHNVIDFGSTLNRWKDGFFGGDVYAGQSLYLTEQAAAGADITADGQIWVKNDAPNTLWFTDDASSDFQVANRSDTLAVFAATTSAALEGVISDETGSGGLLVFNSSPTIVTPTIASFVNATHDHEAAAGGGTLASAATPTAIHDDVSGEFATEKVSPVGADRILIEDSATSFSKKYVQITSLPAGSEINDLAGDGITGIADDQLAVGSGAGTAAYATLPNGAVSYSTAGNAFAQAAIADLSDGGDVVTKVGTPADSQIGVWTGDGTIEGTSDFTFDGADLLIYNAVNDGNPQLRLGSTDLEEARVQAVYELGGQGLEYMLFTTETANAGANFGAFRFVADGTTILEIDDGGIDLQTGMALSINGADVLDATTLGSGVLASSLTSFGSSPTIVTPTIASFVNATHDHEAAAGGGTLASAATPTAIHDDVSGEFATEKGSPVGADRILIEDSATSFSKKYVQITNLPAGSEINNLAGDGISGIIDDQIAIGSGAGTAAYHTLPNGAVSYATGTNTLSQAAVADLSDGGDVMLDTVYDAAGITEQLVGLTATQSLTNKRFDDATTFFQDNGDTTKQLVFQLSSIATLQTRAISWPDQDLNMTPGTGDFATAAEGDLAATALQANSGSITSGFGTIDNGASSITTTGVITGGTVEPTTDTSIGDNAAIGYTAAAGLILTGQGSLNDVTIKNDADLTAFSLLTGTIDVNLHGNVGFLKDLVLTEQADHSSTPAAGFGYLWTKNTDPSTLIFTDDTGVDTTLGSGGGGGELSKAIHIEAPDDAEDLSMFFSNVAITITEIRAIIRGSSTPSVTWTVRHGTDRSATGAEAVTGGTATTSTTTGSDVTSFNDATIVADSFIWIETTAQSGIVNDLNITIFYTED